MPAVIRLGAEAIAGSFVRSPPSVVTTGPASTITTPNVTVTWTYTSIISRAQAQYRVRLLTQDGTTTLFDSSPIVGAVTSYVLPYTLSDGSGYSVFVSVYDGFDWSAEASTSFLVELSDVASYPDEPTVGSVYEVAINGVGYMLADREGQDLEYRRQTVPLEAPRFAQGDTPFSEAVERYSFVGWADWRDGAGQINRNRTDFSQAAYLDSEGINPFEDDGLKLLPSTSLTLANAYASPEMVVASNKLYTQTGTNTFKEVASIGGAVTAFTVAGQTTTLAMASDGTNWYACDGANVHRNSAAADPGAAWSTIDARLMAWAADRLCVAYPSSGTTPNVFSTLGIAGTEEVAGGRLTLPVGSSITAITGGDGYVWFAARRNQQGLVYAWKAGSTDTPFVAFEFPAGQYPTALGFYLGNVFIRTSEPLSAGGAKGAIYRAATSTGRLVPELVVELERSTIDNSTGAWAGDDRFALFSWTGVATSLASGLGCIDLSSGGYSKWLVASDVAATGNVQSIVMWNGRVVFSVQSNGIFHETTVPMSTGFLRTDIADLGTSLLKIYGQLKADLAPLPAGGGISVTYTVDAGSSYSATAFSLTGAGLRSLAGDISKQAASIGLKITLTASATTPVLRSITVRAHPVGLADQVLLLPIKCADKMAGLNGQALPGAGPGTGMARARVLESLAQTRIRLQDVDWPYTDTATIWEVEQVDLRNVVLIFDRMTNKQSIDAVAVVLLRRSLK